RSRSTSRPPSGWRRGSRCRSRWRATSTSPASPRSDDPPSPRLWTTCPAKLRQERSRMSAGVYLEAYLAPLSPWLSRPDVTDVLVNRPGEVWIETANGTMSREPADQLTEVALQRLARQIAAASHQGVNREQPLLSATLPDGARVQVVGPPATRGGVAMAVRKHLISDMS